MDENIKNFIEDVSKTLKTKKRTEEILNNFFDGKIKREKGNSDYVYFLHIKNKLKDFKKIIEKYPKLTYEIIKNPKKID
jgi:hypothetical protein